MGYGIICRIGSVNNGGFSLDLDLDSECVLNDVFPAGRSDLGRLRHVPQRGMWFSWFIQSRFIAFGYPYIWSGRGFSTLDFQYNFYKYDYEYKYDYDYDYDYDYGYSYDYGYLGPLGFFVKTFKIAAIKDFKGVKLMNMHKLDEVKKNCEYVYLFPKSTQSNPCGPQLSLIHI